MPVNNSETDSFRIELARVLASGTFAKAPKQRELLRWLVDYALSGGKPPLSQYAIATQALGYPPTYHPDAGGVRKAVMRLREKLAEYYTGEGRSARFHIVISKEQYQPKLVQSDDLSHVHRSPLAIEGLSHKLTILVLPLLPVGFRDDGCFCEAFMLNLMRALAASGQACVVPWSTAHWLVGTTGDKHEYYRRVACDVMLEGLVHEISKDHVRVTVQWIDGLTTMCDRFHEVRGGIKDSLLLVHDLATQLSRHLQLTYDERAQLQVAMRCSSDPAAAAYYLRARECALTFTPQGIGKAIHLVGQALQRDPYFAAAHALSAEVQLAIGDAGLAPATRHAPLAR